MGTRRSRQPRFREPPAPPDDRKIVVEALGRIISSKHDELACAQQRGSGYCGTSSRDDEERRDALRDQIRALRRIRETFEAVASGTAVDEEAKGG